MKLFNVGFGNTVSGAKILAIVSNESSPVKRDVNNAKEKFILIDTTHGRKTRSVIYLDNGHIVLSAVQHDTLAKRFNSDSSNSDEADPED